MVLTERNFWLYYIKHSNENMIELKKINKTYNSLGGKVHALKNVDLFIGQGEYVFITGKSGSGKSTLLNIISGIDNPDNGEIRVGHTNLNSLSENKLAKWRGQNIGVVFQFYQLLPTLSAFENVLFAMDLVNTVPKNERKKRALELLTEMGLKYKANKFPNELSGGEKQRVAIGRALANDPAILIADEPTGNLDTKNGEMVYEVFKRLNEGGKTIIIVTHEDISEKQFTQAIHIQDGCVQEIKSTV